jgi:Ca2+-binding EF-hand superfamily protein
MSGAVVAQPGFAHADADGDGKIDYEEFRSHMVNTYYRADRNRDGVLKGDELKVLNAGRIPDADRNGDGRLDLKEFLNSTAADFRAADKNRDNVLGPEELRSTSR